MYLLNDQQIDFILNDISARGVEMEDLQSNLLDHVCCIIENNLEENGDFESFYQKTIKTFYKDALWEIEEETITLLTFKNYYTMKKIMIVSGIASSVTLMFGICFKFMHWPGASMLIVLGVLSASLIFIPLLFTLKAKEKQESKDKLVLAVGAISAILISLSFLFKVMHWSYSIPMLYLSTALMFLIFLPLYFYTGLRNPATKTNTISSSILIILAYSLLLVMIRPASASLVMDIKNTRDFLRSQEILNRERLLSQNLQDSVKSTTMQLDQKIQGKCEELKAYILKKETGSENIDSNFESKKIFIADRSFDADETFQNKLDDLTGFVKAYNSEVLKTKEKNLAALPVTTTIVDDNQYSRTYMLTTLGVLNQLTQLQMFLLQNNRQLLAMHSN